LGLLLENTLDHTFGTNFVSETILCSLPRMQRIILTISCFSTKFLVNCEDTCGTWELPNDPVHFSPSHSSQWRLIAREGQKQDGTIIAGVKTEAMYPTVIRGHWAIGELEFYADPSCEGKKHTTLKKDGPVLSPLQTTYGWQDEFPAEHPFLLTLGGESPWYSEMRAIDGCASSEFWSQCYQCKNYDGDGKSAWFGVQFDNDEKDVTQIKCVKIFQKDADAYTATRVELQRWYPDTWGTDGVGSGWSWKKRGDWTGLNGGQWYVLSDNTTVAIDGAHGSTVPSLLGLVGFLLLSYCW